MSLLKSRLAVRAVILSAHCLQDGARLTCGTMLDCRFPEG